MIFDSTVKFIKYYLDSKMKRINILTNGFKTPNQRAFLFPILFHRKCLEDIGLSIRIFSEISSDLFDCDYLAVENKYFSKRWVNERDSVVEEIALLSDAVGGLIYFDITDSSGIDHAHALPHVTVYAKSQLMADKSRYLTPMKGYRPYSDFYAQEHGLKDFDDESSTPISSPALLDRMTVGWNSALADYSWLGPLRMAAYQRIPLRSFLRLPSVEDYPKPSLTRSRAASIRIGTNYRRETVSFQRRSIAELLQGRLDTEKVSRKKYLKEISDSKVVISPFGLGEITLRDFEVMMSGSLLYKPDMSHMTTWPNLFVDGETIISHRWDLDDLLDKLEDILYNFSDYIDIAAEGQRRYFKYVSGESSGELFAGHLKSILDFYDSKGT